MENSSIKYKTYNNSEKGRKRKERYNLKKKQEVKRLKGNIDEIKRENDELKKQIIKLEKENFQLHNQFGNKERLYKEHTTDLLKKIQDWTFKEEDLKEQISRRNHVIESQELYFNNLIQIYLKDNSSNYFEKSQAPKKFKRSTGISKELFERLEVEFNCNFKSNSGISSERRLFITLVWLRHYPDDRMLSHLFQISESNLSRIYHEGVDLLYESLHDMIRWPDEDEIKLILDETEKNLPEVLKGTKVLAIVDGTEVEVSRSIDYNTQNNMYSGKKKKHTLMWQVTVLWNGVIVHLSQAFVGRINDKHMYDKSGLKEYFKGKEFSLMGDSGYQGINEKEKDGSHSSVIVHGVTPVKRKRRAKGQKEKNKLQDDQKDFNQKLSSFRVIVENTIGKMKEFKVLRGFKKGHFSYPDRQEFIQKVFRSIAYLTNLKMEENPLRKSVYHHQRKKVSNLLSLKYDLIE